MNVQRQIDRLIAFQAAEWYETLKDANAAQQADFTRWISESPRHMEAFLAISSEAPMVRKVLASGEFDLKSLLQEVAADPKIVALPAPRDTQSPSVRSNPGVWKRKRTFWAIAATLAAVAIAVPLQIRLTGWQRFETPRT